MNELSYDQLLKIESNHPISCPDINALKFCGGMCSRVYNVSLDYNPSDLVIDMSDLVRTTDRLESWAYGVLKNFSKLPDELSDCIFFDNYKIDELLLSKELDTLKEMSININKTISFWQSSIEIRDNKLIEISSKTKEIEDLEKDLLLTTLSDNSLMKVKKGLIESKYKEIIYIENEIKENEFLFYKDIAPLFENEVELFSDKLEVLRERNDDLRVETSNLKRDLIDNAKEYLDLYMPTEYLDMRFDEDNNKEINIGVFFNDLENDSRTNESNFFNTIKRIGEKANLTFHEKETLMDLYSNKKDKKELISEVIDFIKNKGFEKVRYYIDSKDYLENRSNFIEEKLNSKNLKKIKL